MLRVKYNIRAGQHSAVFVEAHGRMQLPVYIAAPVVAPGLVIESASYAPKRMRRGAWRPVRFRSWSDGAVVDHVFLTSMYTVTGCVNENNELGGDKSPAGTYG